MKNYELTVLIHPDLEVNPDPAIDKVKKTIELVGGKITKEEAEGKRRLAYAIGGQTFALYYFFDVTLPSDAPNKISAVFNITDEIIRYLLVRVDERKAKLAAKSSANAASDGAKEDTAKEETTPSSQEDKEDE